MCKEGNGGNVLSQGELGRRIGGETGVNRRKVIFYQSTIYGKGKGSQETSRRKRGEKLPDKQISDGQKINGKEGGTAREKQNP